MERLENEGALDMEAPPVEGHGTFWSALAMSAGGLGLALFLALAFLALAGQT